MVHSAGSSAPPALLLPTDPHGRLDRCTRQSSPPARLLAVWAWTSRSCLGLRLYYSQLDPGGGPPIVTAAFECLSGDVANPVVSYAGPSQEAVLNSRKRRISRSGRRIPGSAGVVGFLGLLSPAPSSMPAAALSGSVDPSFSLLRRALEFVRGRRVDLMSWLFGVCCWSVGFGLPSSR